MIYHSTWSNNHRVAVSLGAAKSPQTYRLSTPRNLALPSHVHVHNCWKFLYSRLLCTSSVLVSLSWFSCIFCLLFLPATQTSNVHGRIWTRNPCKRWAADYRLWPLGDCLRFGPRTVQPTAGSYTVSAIPCPRRQLPTVTARGNARLLTDSFAQGTSTTVHMAMRTAQFSNSVAILFFIFYLPTLNFSHTNSKCRNVAMLLTI